MKVKELFKNVKWFQNVDIFVDNDENLWRCGFTKQELEDKSKEFLEFEVVTIRTAMSDTGTVFILMMKKKQLNYMKN